jgi:hypothetical protein
MRRTNNSIDNVEDFMAPSPEDDIICVFFMNFVFTKNDKHSKTSRKYEKTSA